MKTKLSVTLDEQLLAFVDSEHGPSRSEKIERILRRYRDARRDAQLRRELSEFNAPNNNESDADAWRAVMEEAQWSESGEATSGPSRSRRSRSRARR